jgi:hypothetical protein
MLNPAAEVVSSRTSDHGEGRAKLGTTVKLRLSVLISIAVGPINRHTLINQKPRIESDVELVLLAQRQHMV